MKRLAILVLSACIAIGTVGSIPTKSPTFATGVQPIVEESEVPVFDDQRGVFIIRSTGTIYMIDKGGLPGSTTFVPNATWTPTE